MAASCRRRRRPRSPPGAGGTSVASGDDATPRGYHRAMTPTRFPFRLSPRSGALLRVFGVRGVENAYVDLDPTTFLARLGRFTVSTPVANITAWRIEGP